QVRAARLVIRGGRHFSSKTVIGCRGLSNWLVMTSRLPAEPRPAEDGQPEVQVRAATEFEVRVAGGACCLAEEIPFMSGNDLHAPAPQDRCLPDAVGEANRAGAIGGPGRLNPDAVTRLQRTGNF